MAKRGRPKKVEPSTTENPFDRNKQEAMFLAYEHGFNSMDKEENPYLDMPEMSSAMSAWNQGFNANKKRTKRIKPSPDKDLEATDRGYVPPADHEIEMKQINRSLIELPDHVIIGELKKRKQKELDVLLKEKAKIDARVAQLQAIMDL